MMTVDDMIKFLTDCKDRGDCKGDDRVLIIDNMTKKIVFNYAITMD